MYSLMKLSLITEFFSSNSKIIRYMCYIGKRRFTDLIFNINDNINDIIVKFSMDENNDMNMIVFMG